MTFPYGPFGQITFYTVKVKRKACMNTYQDFIDFGAHRFYLCIGLCTYFRQLGSKWFCQFKWKGKPFSTQISSSRISRIINP